MRIIKIILYFLLTYSLSANDFLNLQAPIGGEKFYFTDTISIEYKTDIIDTIKIEYFDVRESKWYLIDDNIISTEGKNKFNWISPDLDKNLYCHIRLTGSISISKSINLIKFIHKPQGKNTLEIEADMFNNESSKIRILPNPATTNIVVETTFEYEKFEVYDIYSRKYSCNSNNDIIDISQLSSGTYFLLIKNKDKTEVVKFIKN